ncbi:helix-turn-helix transcriptional regulator [Streptomyces sp. NBC_01016]|uniref:helix-turn-helix transcriptional regulator n=1 Tax=Streptomyces sp. NBC_01016 TaxID=2903720 RepID=UPI0022515B0D|nr:helix-turn-helix transcriptional regulator [Streptomyces sp. NBC_01016]MCX4830130.1 helix-turn-helix transcriptional regulator [Streptomyces sp. NBC_01016]
MSGGYAERAARVPGAVVWTRTVADDESAAAPVLPDGCMDLIWSEGRLFVAGPDTRAHSTDPGEGRRYAGIRFAPGTAPGYLGVPAHELRDTRVELERLWQGSEARRLTERLDAAADPAAELEDLAARLAHVAGPPDPLLTHVARALDAGRTVTSVADETGLGARTLHRRSLAAFGYGPKTLARVLRLQRALALVRADVPFAEAAARAGYTDQAHLARDVRDLTGRTLSELRRRA